MRHRRRLVCTLIPAAALLGGAGELAPEPADVGVTVTGLRSSKGEVLACMTSRPDAFPQCQHDPRAKALRVPAAATVRLDFGEVPLGRYAISLFHDENANGRLDKRLVVPREGYGFSRNARVVMGPPSFAAAAFAVGAGGHHETIRMRYIF